MNEASDVIGLGIFRANPYLAIFGVGINDVNRNIPRVRPYLKILGVRSTARLTIEDGPMVKSGQKAHFCNAIVYESYAGSPNCDPGVLLFLLFPLFLSFPCLPLLRIFLFVIIGRLVLRIPENL